MFILFDYDDHSFPKNQAVIATHNSPYADRKSALIPPAPSPRAGEGEQEPFLAFSLFPSPFLGQGLGVRVL